jgi:hypothetical protein
MAHASKQDRQHGIRHLVDYHARAIDEVLV